LLVALLSAGFPLRSNWLCLLVADYCLLLARRRLGEDGITDHWSLASD